MVSTEEEFDPLSLLGPPPIMSSENKVKVEEEERSLYFLLRFHKSNVENVQARIGKYPDEVKKKEGRYDSLPLHTALMYRASVEVVLLLINVYPEAARVDKALHHAIEWKRSKRDNLLSVVKALLDVYPEGVKERYNGRLPLTRSLQMGGTDDEVLALLAAYPQAAEQVDSSDSDNDPDAESETLQEGDPLLSLLGNKPAKVAPSLPLHYAIIEMRSQKVLNALLDAYPDAAKEKNPQTGNLPLHDALEDALKRQEAEEVILLLLNAYPQAAKEKMKDGRLPIEVCAKNKASDGLMLALYKADPKSRVEGLLPLGRVLTDGSSDDVVLDVLQAYPEAAKDTFSTKSDVRILPLHIAHEDECSDKVKKALLDAYPGAEEEENPFKTTLRLHKLLEDSAPDDDVLDLINNYPDAVGKRGRDGRRPLHIAVHKASQDVITTLFHKYPQAAKERMEDGRLPIEVCAENYVSEDLMLSLLEIDMPVSIEDGTPIEHCGSWFSCVSSNTDGATGAVRRILSMSDGGGGFGNRINALAEVRDDQGRTALSLAAIGPRVEINKYLLFCGRYKLFDGPPEHRTATSVILRAQDVGVRSDYGYIFDMADEDGNGKLERKELKAIAISIGLNPDLFLKGSDDGSTLSKETFVDICMQQLGDGPREVVIKLMKNKDQWERECNARMKNILHSKYVVSALSNVPSEDVIAKAVERGEGGLTTIVTNYLNDITLGKYAFVMDAAGRNLHQIFFQEQPNIDAVRVILKQVFEAVNHLHEEKLMHGDIKMGNIMRFRIDNKLRLIDLDASARIDLFDEQSCAGAKFSSAILPPEMIEKIETDQVQGFLKYWKVQNDKDLKKKVAPKIYLEQGIVKAHYVVKSFRTDEEGKPVEEGLPYKLVHASESIDLWSLGVLAFTLLTGEPLIPSTRDDDCASGAAMHILHSWGTQPEVLIELSRKIADDFAFDLVWKLLQKEPEKRPRVASLLKEHPFFNPRIFHPQSMDAMLFEDVLERRSSIFENLLFYGRYKLIYGPPEHRSQTSVVFRAHDLDQQADYGVTFDKADKNEDGNLDLKELKRIASSIGLDPALLLKGSDAISKEEFVGICKRQLGDGPREVVIKLMQKKNQWDRECNARKENSLNQKYVVTAQPVIPPEDDIANAKGRGDGGLNVIVEKFLKDIKLGNYVIVMPAADRNLHEIFHQEQPNIDAVRDMLTQVFEAVKHLHEEKLMHGDIKMGNIMRFRIDNRLCLIDLDASARIVPRGGDDETFAGVKFSSAILPPEMIEKIETDQIDDFNAYWEGEEDEVLIEKVAPKIYKEPGKLKSHYVVKSFSTDEEGKPVDTGLLPYRLVRASENIDLWSLGVLAFTLLTGEKLIPSTRDDDCASGADMHLLHSWGTQPEVLSDLYKKITDDAARDLVMQLLKSKPEERPTVAALLAKHPFFNQKNLAIISQFNERLKDFGETLQSQAKQLEKMNANILVIKQLSYKNQSELLRTRHVLLKGIFEATEVRTPTTFIILNNVLPTAVDPSDEETKNKILEIIAREDGSGVSMKTKQATLTATAEGVEIDLEGDLKEYRDQFGDRIKWAKAIKNIGTNFAAGNIDEAFDNIKDGIKDLIVGNEMYLYLIDDLTGDPVQAEGWPIPITTPSDVVPTLLPLMQLGMIGLSFYTGTAGMARLFGYPLPKVPKAWSKGAQE
eukprot:CAMPEP_0113416640 /NCGR_PEP_ID=MMETSP0013_2-20120614/25227_1 /TAXON_ID=2843 ORGANISM="Skeletonema costatum, Strain 1716" /NCGR_SAMPLE_ID=MMETSP0013_2 /ASSEMBLY_ACC=CAM_ASM_000158 /LENGTH=1678 /DNA_ID=CAMNT_0000303715 /DNA_START=200 /DNA_END=5233 /DNA_ORIENTATION=- /assembly_acc=CAM_ASM_000158